MDRDAAHSLRRLLATRPVAALGTLHRGAPAVSMVPFVLPAGETRVFIHVSALATHTADMRSHPRVSLLVMAEPGADASPQALARVSLQADARTLARDEADHAAARAATSIASQTPPRRSSWATSRSWRFSPCRLGWWRASVAPTAWWAIRSSTGCASSTSSAKPGHRRRERLAHSFEGEDACGRQPSAKTIRRQSR